MTTFFDAAADITQPTEALIRARNDNRRAAHEGDRRPGVCWSGMQNDPYREPSAAETAAQVADARARDEHWRQTPTRALLQACSDINGDVEAIRNVISRAGVPDRLAAANRTEARKALARLVYAAEQAALSLEAMDATAPSGRA